MCEMLIQLASICIFHSRQQQITHIYTHISRPVSMNSPSKIFNDPIHGHIEISSLCVRIIDTPEFQRLRDISQLGGVYYVFPGAASKRFEHCIGVSHLAKTFVCKLREEQPELKITDADVLCVEVAGLCHDLGHGPFSHLYDGKFLKAVNPQTDFVHEHASVGILDLLIRENSLEAEFEKHNLTSDDIHFIKELILGDEAEAPEGFTWKGRGDKTFLYDIVANKRNGIDVDKFDYFARDCHVLGLTKSFDCLRLMRFARVHTIHRSASGDFVDSAANTVEIEDTSGHTATEICYHIKEAWNLFELFHTRYALHKRAYQHKVACAVELMITEALVAANNHVTIPGLNGTPRRMSDCPLDMHAYWKLGEYLIRQIENSTDDKLQESRDIMRRLRKRDIFAHIGEILLTPSQKHLAKDGGVKAKADLLEIIYAQSPPGGECEITEKDVICVVVKMGYGKGGKNPVMDLTAFYRPEKRHSTECDESSQFAVGILPPASVSRLIPTEFEELYLRVYTRYKHHRETVTKAFDKWCDLMESSSNAPFTLSPTKSPRKKRKTAAD